MTTGIFRAEALSRCDVVTLEGALVTSIRVKPEEPLSDLVGGYAATRAGVLHGAGAGPSLVTTSRDSPSEERFAEFGSRDPFVDIGMPEALRQVYGEAGTEGSPR